MTERQELRRELGAWGAGSIVVGTMIGSGIFLVPKTMILAVGAPSIVILVWVAGGLLSLAGALTYAELSAALPQAGGEYIYLKEAYGPFWGFLYAWTWTWVAKSGSLAAMATGFSYYLAHFVPALDRTLFNIPLPLGESGNPLPVTGGQVLAMGLIAALGAANRLGVQVGGGMQVIATALKLALIGGIIWAGLSWGGASLANLTSRIEARAGWTGFFAALVAALWAYDGWNNACSVAGEVKNPQKGLPAALALGTLTVMAVYLGVNFSYFLVLDADSVAASDRVAAVMMDRIFAGAGGSIVSLAAMISIFAALNGALLAGARVPYAAAKDGLFFGGFAGVNPHGAPGFSLLALCLWSALLVLSGRYDQLLTLVIFPSWILYGMSAAAVLVLRRKRPALARPYRVPGFPLVPLGFLAAATCLTIATLINSARESLMGLSIMISGVPFYLWWRGKGRAAASGYVGGGSGRGKGTSAA